MNQQVVIKCQRCGQLQVIKNVPALPFQKRIFLVLDNTFYIAEKQIDDFKMVCDAISRAKVKGSLEFNNINYNVKDSILYIDGEEIGDHYMVIRAIKRAEKLTRKFSPLICSNPACGREGSFKILSPQEFERIKERTKGRKKSLNKDGKIRIGRSEVNV